MWNKNLYLTEEIPASGWKSGYHPRLWAKSFPGKKKMILTLAAVSSVCTGWSCRVCRKTTGLKQMLLEGSLYTAGPSGQRKWRRFQYSTCGIWARQTLGWNAYVNPARQHKLIRVFAACKEEDLGNIKCSYCCQMLHASSWQRSLCSTLGMCFHWKCQAAWMEQMLMGCVGARNSTRNTHVLFLTFSDRITK